MEEKKSLFPTKPTQAAKKKIDEWVIGKEAEVVDNRNAEEPLTKKLTVMVTDKLHKKVRIDCLERDITVQERLFELIKKEFEV